VLADHQADRGRPLVVRGPQVVIRVQDEKQTKESARRYVIYCVALGHMFLL